MKREDLRVMKTTGRVDTLGWRPVTAAEFADIATAEGYVKLDDPQVVAEWTMTYEVDEDDLRAQGFVRLDGFDRIDADHLAWAISTLSDGHQLREITRHNAEEFVVAVAACVTAARQVLAALEGDTDV